MTKQREGLERRAPGVGLLFGRRESNALVVTSAAFPPDAAVVQREAVACRRRTSEG